ncbi:hypothetical protein SELMODRAFT_451574 [Selaginella moellendorffii]|uniref:Uncharacterized protein TPD1C1-1 n=1 Tax=Selaginella moellendorffii TaxID=88036 RepID=D8RQE2_SELML|nr:hypothetical protein SELMODRAFT_451575 [Selaginella moellendorffii]EFJ25842.1 hypothetical protein SELMODRAFT_451574 [Selaginella moellendorffii]
MRKMILVEASLKLFALYIFLSVLPASSKECSKRDIVISQGDSGGLEYEVVIVNECEDSLCDIHVDCGTFSSYKLVDPGVFRRLSPGDCLVLDGGPLPPRRAIRFVYMNDRKFPMLVKDAIFC